MPIMSLKMNNILSFYNFSINFSYPVKLRNSMIKDENLSQIPSFRYKKLNVFVGANASGKTSLITCVWRILLFLNKKERVAIDDLINDNHEISTIEIDLITNQKNDMPILHRFKIRTNNFTPNKEIFISHSQIILSAGASYENKVKELDSFEDDFKDYLECLNEADIKTGWTVTLPATEMLFDEIRFVQTLNEIESKEYLQILNQVLKTLDSSIIAVSKSLDANDAYVIEHETKKKIIVQAGNKLSNIMFLSSGTKYGFNIANMIFAIKHNRNKIYLIDEQFSYVNSDVEAAVLSTIVSMLGPDEQIFFTTHNQNILSLGFPFHSFNFMKKEEVDDKHIITAICASEAENRNNVSPKSLLDNDVFATAPKVDKIFELGEKDE